MPILPGVHPSATIYQDPSGRFYVVDTRLQNPEPRTFAIRPLFDGETASLLNRRGAQPGQLQAKDPPPPPPAMPSTWLDPARPGLILQLGSPFPVFHYGQLISHQGRLYSIEMADVGSLRLFPDDATLASKGFSAGQAILVSDDDFRFFPIGLPYLPVSPSPPVLTQGNLRAELYLYSLSAAGTPQRQLLVGKETADAHRAVYSFVGPVKQSEIDAVPFAAVARIEEFYEKVITVTRVECIKQAHRSFLGMGGGDDFEVRACLDRPESIDHLAADTYDHLIWKNHLDEGNHQDIAAGNTLQFKQITALRIFVNGADDTYSIDGSGQRTPTHGWLACPASEIWFDTALTGSGDQTLVFTAKTGGVGSGDWTVEYHLTVRVDYARANGQLLPISKSDYPNNIYRIKHFFMVMMENRSFDHLLGANQTLRPRLRDPIVPPPENAPSNILGWPASGYLRPYAPAIDPLSLDIGHEINHVMAQLVGQSLVDQDLNGKNQRVLDAAGKLLVPVNMGGFRDSYLALLKGAKGDPNAADRVFGLMQPAVGQAYAVNELAETFQFYERWHASVPSSTWPNRYFVHCGTSGGITVSPDGVGGKGTNMPQIVDYVTGSGFNFKNQSIFHRLSRLGVPWRVYHSGYETQVWSIQGLSPLWEAPAELPLIFPALRSILLAWFQAQVGQWGWMLLDGTLDAAGLYAEFTTLAAGLAIPILNIFILLELAREIEWLVEHILAMLGITDYEDANGLQRDFDKHFAKDVAADTYLPFYTFIEPNQETNSGHPTQHEQVSEDYLASIYKAVRASPMWARGECAMLIVYDEHGGFYDHVPPPYNASLNPAEDTYRRFGDDVGDGWPETYHDFFDFSLLGIRVPALIVSPYNHQGRRSPPPAPNPGKYYEHASIVKTLQRRLGDTNYLTPRVANTEDLFDAFGNMPLAAGDADLAPAVLAKYYKGASVTPLPRPEVQLPVTAHTAARSDFHLARAAEIRYRCDLVNDPSVFNQILAAALKYPTVEQRIASVETALSDRQQGYRAEAPTTRGSVEAKRSYASDTDGALETYRKNLAQFRTGYQSALAKSSPKDRYDALRSAAQKLDPGRGVSPDYPDGVLLKGTSDAIYVIQGGLRRGIPDPETFDYMGLEWAAVWTLGDDALHLIPDGGVLASQGGLTLDAAALDWGGVPLRIRTTKSVTLHNGARANTVVVNCTVMGGNGFDVTPRSLSIPAGGSASVSIGFVPEVETAASASLQLDYSYAGGARAKTVALHGAGAAAHVSLSASSLAFGDTALHDFAIAQLTLTNSGDLWLNASNLSATGPFVVIGTLDSLTLGPRASVTIPVAFTPSAVGAATGALSFNSTDPAHAAVTIALSGSGAVEPARPFTVAPVSLAFNTLNTGVKASRVAVTNTSGQDASVAIATMGDAFSAAPNPIVVAPGQSGFVTVTFSPADTGTYGGILAITGPGGARVAVPLRGGAREKEDKEGKDSDKEKEKEHNKEQGKDGKEHGKEGKENAKENAKEHKDGRDGGENLGAPDAPAFLRLDDNGDSQPGVTRSFIRPAERPPVGERLIQGTSGGAGEQS